MSKEKPIGEAEVRDAKAKTPLQKFYIPELDRIIEAESIEEATKIAEKEKLNNK